MRIFLRNTFYDGRRRYKRDRQNGTEFPDDYPLDKLPSGAEVLTKKGERVPVDKVKSGDVQKKTEPEDDEE